MRRKKVLMACANYWTSPFQVGSHHIAKGFLEQGWEVAFVSDPISPLHIFAGISQELKERYHIYFTGGIAEQENMLWYYVPGAMITPYNKPILKTQWAYENWFNLTIPNIVHKIRQKGFDKVDLLYIDSVIQKFWMDEIKYHKSVLRIADKTAGFTKNPPIVCKIEKELAQAVDVVVYTAHSLKDYVSEMKPSQIFHLPNGVNFDHFYYGSRTIPEDLKNIPKPIAVYVGAMAEWFDYKLINQAAKMLPEVSFVLIGPQKLAQQKLDKLPNIYLLGKKEYQMLPSYLYNSDIGLIPFNISEYPDLVHNINPLKLYEYMACGLPVVATTWDELKKINSPAILCEGHSEFIDNIAKLVQNMPERTDYYVTYAKTHTWSDRVGDLLNFLSL